METETNIGKIRATTRTGFGKEEARKLRSKGLIPAVCYGLKNESISITLDPADLKKALDPAKRINTLFDLTIDDGSGQTEQVKVMIKDFQVDSLKQTIMHADFIRVSMEQDVEVSVRLEFTGKSEGIKMGGELHQIFRSLPVKCKPDNIPTVITGDITSLDINQSLQVKDIPLPEGVTINLPSSQTLVHILAQKGVEGGEETKAEGAVAAEDAAKTEGAAKAAPAESKGKGKDKS